MRALISVSDKLNLIQLCERLRACGIELVSTSGTAKAIKESGLPCTLVEEVTGFPEMLDGRVRTLHPNIFAGIIADQANPMHMETITRHGILPFHFVFVNLYDFAGHPSIEQIDVGGPSMLRAAAKNYGSVAVVCDPDDYEDVLRQLEMGGEVDQETRLRLAAKAFRHTANYDVGIADHFEAHVRNGTIPEAGKKH